MIERPIVNHFKLFAVAVCCISVIGFAATSYAADDALTLKGDMKAGAQMYNAVCKGCHSVSIAPTLRGVVDRPIASVTDFPNYTDGLKAKQPLTWSKENLSAFLINPMEFAPGTLMIQTIADPQQRADMLAFLEAYVARK